MSGKSASGPTGSKDGNAPDGQLAHAVHVTFTSRQHVLEPCDFLCDVWTTPQKPSRYRRIYGSKSLRYIFAMRCMPLFPSVLLLGMGSTTSAQGDLSGRQQYPQFRVLSGQPGGGYGVLPNGRPDVGGAAALATPIGYTLGRGSYVFGVFNTGSSLDPFQFDSEDATENTGNGSAFGNFGVSYRGWNMSVGGMVLSTDLDNVLNLQISPPQRGRVGFSAGIQDFFTTGGASGESIDRRTPLLSRSFFIVGTYDFGRGIYFSLGKGERRFQGLFGNFSLPITERLRAMAEYDSFNFNAGLLYDMG
ncbi:MAG: hypothetical protein EOP84_37170, partial [Verrucomicrobiaceae bacterium]